MYAGSRTSSYDIANPDQLLTSYFTSSTTVKALIESGVAFEIVRTKTFDDAESTLAFESRFLRLYKCVKDKNWYNRHDGRELSPFGCGKYNDALEQKYGYRNAMHIPSVVQRVSDNLKGAINCWDEELQERRRVPIDEYKAFPDRYWHVQSHKYRDKYKNGEVLVKNASRTYYNVYNQTNELVYSKLTNFRTFCDKHGLPSAALHRSAKHGGERIYWLDNRLRKASPEHTQYRGWYAVWVDKDDIKQDYLPIEPSYGIKHVTIERKSMLDYPTVIVVSSPDNNVLAIYRMSANRAAERLGILADMLNKAIKHTTPLYTSPTGQIHAKRSNKSWLIGCFVTEVAFDDQLVGNNLDKLIR